MNIDALHDNLFRVLCTIDDIAKKEKVPYFITFGTAIGAVREKDFIPWDDDMDLLVRAEDFPAFLAAMKKNLPEHMHIVESKDFAPHFYDFVARIYDDRYFVHEETEEDRFYGNHQNHIGTDVFFVSNLPDGKLAQKLYILCIKTLYGLGMAHRFKVKDEKYSMLQKLQVAVLRTAGKLIPAKTICNLWWKFINRWKDVETEYSICPNIQLYALKKLPARIYKGEAADGFIRGRAFPLVPGYDEEMTIYYGNYMKPPKDIKRYIQHISPEDQKELERRWIERLKREEEQ